MNDYPEVGFAGRLSAIRKLSPPVDVFGLAQEYASLRIVDLPFEIDGVCMNLKVRGKRPSIILNGRRPDTRRRFTLAHEIGHIIIPWHMGTIVDNTEQHVDDADGEYWNLEDEANRFASELLLPRKWIIEVLKDSGQPAKALKRLVTDGQVSAAAAAIALIQTLPAGYVFVELDADNIVVRAGRSERTHASPPRRGERLQRPERSRYEHSDDAHTIEINKSRYIFWRFAAVLRVPTDVDPRGWREILDGILTHFEYAGDDRKTLRSRMNAVIGYAYSVTKHGDAMACYSVAWQRLESRPEWREILQHPDFEVFLSKRVEELLNR